MSGGAEQEGSLAFVDTNVLVYSVDDSEPRRRMQAVELLRSLVSTEALCTSTQVLGEFFVTVTRKIQVPISASKALQGIEGFAAWPVVAIDTRLVSDACELSLSSKISYWDALIVAAAARAGASRLYSEDLQAGQKLLGVEVVNPFAQK